MQLKHTMAAACLAIGFAGIPAMGQAAETTDTKVQTIIFQDRNTEAGKLDGPVTWQVTGTEKAVKAYILSYAGTKTKSILAEIPAAHQAAYTYTLPAASAIPAGATGLQIELKLTDNTLTGQTVLPLQDDRSAARRSGWVQEGGIWSYYDPVTKQKKTGWMQDGGKWYYLNSSGAMQTGWMQDGGKWYYLNSSGAMQTGWMQDGGKWYYLNSSGAMQTGWMQDGGKWYYLNSSGAMQTGWMQDGGKWYYLNNSGIMQTGWVSSGGGSYYLGADGAVSAAKLSAPLINQNPELPRGCEVTSLAMLLQYAGLAADKMTLAREVKKDPTPYSKRNGTTYFGNPNTGFVGSMYTFSQPGYGVYHGPIAELANRYMPDRIIDFSGSRFETIYDYLNSGKPVWVVNNVLFDTVPSAYWTTWQTPTGPISITMKEHSVLVTGYDDTYIYFNDPLAVQKNRAVKKEAFRRGWEQMGKQAISYR